MAFSMQTHTHTRHSCVCEWLALDNNKNNTQKKESIEVL